MSETPISPLRARMLEDMSVRKFGEATQRDYVRHVKTFSTATLAAITGALPLYPQQRTSVVDLRQLSLRANF